MACCRYDRDDAEEVLQTVYLAVLDGKARCDARSSFRTWVFAVIRRTAASERRRSWLHRVLVQREAGRLEPQAAALTDATAERDSRTGALQRAMASLSARQREVLQLVFYHDLTVEEAAATMGVGVGSARTHYQRGKERLASLLADTREL
jgi:RNA polymerase sigma-70 factor (ECF subfamily)